MNNDLRKREKSVKAKVSRQDTKDDKRKQKSLNEIAGGSAFSGSSYNAKGNVDHGKIKSNKKRR